MTAGRSCIKTARRLSNKMQSSTTAICFQNGFVYCPMNSNFLLVTLLQHSFKSVNVDDHVCDHFAVVTPNSRLLLCGSLNLLPQIISRKTAIGCPPHLTLLLVEYVPFDSGLRLSRFTLRAILILFDSSDYFSCPLEGVCHRFLF